MNAAHAHSRPPAGGETSLPPLGALQGARAPPPAAFPHGPPKTGLIGKLVKTIGLKPTCKINYSAFYKVATFCLLFKI